MTETILDLFSVYGLPAVAAILAVAQFGLPLPTSILLLSAGALQATGDLVFWQVFAWSLAGAMTGDHAGYATGRLASRTIRDHASRRQRLAAGLAKAEAFTRRWGDVGIFLSRWLISPLGPYINMTSGLARHPLWRFTLADLTGESIWVGGYLTLGVLFGSQIGQIADLIANASWLIGFLALTLWLGWLLLKAVRRAHARSHRVMN